MSVHIQKITPEMQAKYHFQFNYVGKWVCAFEDKQIMVTDTLREMLQILNGVEALEEAQNG